MANTKLKNIPDPGHQKDEDRRSKIKSTLFHPTAKFKTKRKLIGKVKALGEEFLAWLLNWRSFVMSASRQ